MNRGSFLPANYTKYTSAIIIFIAVIFSTASAQNKTIDRTHDPVIVKGADLPGMVGQKIANLMLYGVKGGSAYPIPYQIDERDPQGNFALPRGKKPTKDNDGGVFDDNDELVFMVFDLGNKVDATKLKTSIQGMASAVELEVKDPVNGKKGWAYLVSFAGAAPKPSPVDYVRYDDWKKIVKTPLYMVKYGPGENAAFLDGVFLSKEGGGPGFETNLIDRIKIRMDGKLKLGMGVHKTEDDFVSKILAYKDGPVRLIRRSGNSMIIALKIPSTTIVIEDTYYRSFYEYPANVKVPAAASVFLKNMEVRMSYDMAEHQGRKFYSSGNPEGIMLDGKPGPDEAGLKKNAFKWVAIASTLPNEKGAFVGIIKFETEPESLGMKREVLLFDDKSKPDPPERIPGSFGQVGIILKNAENLPKGIFKLNTYLFNVPKFNPRDIKPVMDVLDRPVVSSAKDL